MPQESDVEPAQPRSWPPAFAPSLVDDSRARLSQRSILLVSGPVAGDRDLLASEIAGLRAGPSLARHVARHGEASLAYFGLTQLTRARSNPISAVVDVDALVAEVRRDLAQYRSPRWTLLANAELCDPPSVEVLVRLAEAGDIRLVATTVPGALDRHPRLLEAADVLEVPVLDEAAVAELVAIRFGAAADETLTDLLLRRSRGSRELLRQLADTADEAGLLAVDDGVLHLAHHTADAPGPGPGRGALHPVAVPTTDDPLLVDLVEVTSLLGELDLPEARTCFGRAVVDAARERSVLTTAPAPHRQATSGDAVAFTFRAEQKLVQRSLSGTRRAELLDLYGNRLDRSVRRPGVAVQAADWWLAAGRPLPVRLAVDAAHEANLQGHYRRALVFTDPGNNDGQRVVAPAERGFALIELGAGDDFLDLVQGVDPSTLTEDELLAYFRAVTLLEDAERDRLAELALAVGDPATRRRREAIRALADLVHLTFVRSDDTVATRLRALAFSGQLSPANRALAFATLSAALRSSAHTEQALRAAEFALELIAEDGSQVSAFHGEVTRELHIAALLSMLDVAGAERSLEVYASGGFASRHGGRLAPVLRAIVLMQRGEIAGALDHAERYLADLGDRDPHQVRGLVEAMVAQCLVLLEREEDALPALEAADRHPSPVPQIDMVRRTTMAAARDALAEPEEALEILNGVIDEASTRGLTISRIEAAGAAVLVGGPPQLQRLLDAVDHLDDPVGVPQVWQTFARAASAYDIPTIVDLAGQLEAQDARLSAAGVAQFVLDMARRATDLDATTRHHLTGLADLSGAVPDGDL